MRLKVYLVFILFNTLFWRAGISFAQNTQIDSLLFLLKADKEDSNKVIHLNKLSNEFRIESEYDIGLEYGTRALTLALTLNFEKGIAQANNNIGNIYYYTANYPGALTNYFAALKIQEELKDKQGIANLHNNIGVIYKNQGNYPEALKNHFASLKIKEEIKDKKGIAASYNNIALIYDNQGNYEGALKNNFSALKIREEIGDKRGVATSYMNIGNIYTNQGNYEDALKNHLASLKIKNEIGDKEGIAACYNNIGNVYISQGNYDEVLKNNFAALKIQEEIGDRDGIATSFINLGVAQVKLACKEPANQKSLKLAIAQAYLNKALLYSKEIGNKDDIKDSYESMTTLDSVVGNFKLAFEHHKLSIAYRDSLDNEETKKKTIQSAMAYEFDKKEIAAKAEQEKLNAISAEEKQKQVIVIYAVAGVLLLVIVFSLFLFNRFRITQRQKNIIETQKVLVDKAYESLHEKNKEVLDSIYYASRIQRALITSEKYIERTLNRLRKSG